MMTQPDQTSTAKQNPAPPTWLEAHKRSLFLFTLFLVIFLAVRLTIRRINDNDYIVHTRGVQAYWNGQSPYAIDGYFLPPWDVYLLAPVANLPIETWLALDVALFTVMVMDVGSPFGLLLLVHPIFITLIASANPEWLMIGVGLWLLYRMPKGWGRGLAWLFLASKPQSTFLLLIPDGIDALWRRDWKAIILSGSVAVVSWILVPGFLSPNYLKSVTEMDLSYSVSTIHHFGVLGAVFVAAIIIAIRWRRLKDLKTLGLILSPVFSPYMLEYSGISLLFTMRKAGWLRNIVYVVVGIGLAALFWQEYHVSEHLAILGMTLLTAILAPAYLGDKQTAPPEKFPATPQPAES